MVFIRLVAEVWPIYMKCTVNMQSGWIIGKGAAALMVLGGVERVYADVISTPALTLLQEAKIAVTFGQEVPRIENRTKTGLCPLESACVDLRDAAEIYPVIKQFMAQLEGAQQAARA